ncbi:MAG: multicopper oxidase domain-containing protein [Ilumatobacteraceae bacterium]
MREPDDVLADGTKVFNITAKKVCRRSSPASSSRPPRTTVWCLHRTSTSEVGDKVQINLKNDLPEATSMHFHGVRARHDGRCRALHPEGGPARR